MVTNVLILAQVGQYSISKLFKNPFLSQVYACHCKQDTTFNPRTALQANILLLRSLQLGIICSLLTHTKDVQTEPHENYVRWDFPVLFLLGFFSVLYWANENISNNGMLVQSNTKYAGEIHLWKINTNHLYIGSPCLATTSFKDYSQKQQWWKSKFTASPCIDDEC